MADRGSENGCITRSALRQRLSSAIIGLPHAICETRSAKTPDQLRRRDAPSDARPTAAKREKSAKTSVAKEVEEKVLNAGVPECDPNPRV